jgi:iron complex outermembrane receptor protein
VKQNSTFKKNSIALAVTLAIPALVAAQEAPQPEPKMQRVEVTGSSIKRTEAEAAGSIQVLTRDDIEKTGQTTALGILTATSSISTDISSASSSSGSFATGASGVTMRGLSKVATLVLVNGRRIAPYGLADGAQQNFTNLDAIASDAIERIEILKDGASAIYGSDAIAGVVNIILRSNYQGAQIKGQYGEASHFNDARNRNVSAIWGYGDIDKNGFNTYLTAEVYKTDGYSTGDLQSLYPAWHRQTPGRSTWDAKSSFSPTGNYFLSSTNIVAAPGCPSRRHRPDRQAVQMGCAALHRPDHGQQASRACQQHPLPHRPEHQRQLRDHHRRRRPTSTSWHRSASATAARPARPASGTTCWATRWSVRSRIRNCRSATR